MGATPSKSFNTRINEWLNPAKWEAPDRSFFGHRDILVRNRARYQFVLQHVQGDLLEVGCGRGYGLEVLRQKSRKQMGLDVSALFLKDAHSLLPATPLVQASGSDLPFAPRSFDSLIAFDVIEHIPDDGAFLRRVKQVVRPGGLAAISTPNRLVASGASERPLDLFHVREYLYTDFLALLRVHFPIVYLYGQHDQWGKRSRTNRLLDKIPIRWKYWFPTIVQGWLSVFFRSPLQLDDCVFSSGEIETAHTFVALCYS